MTATITPTDGMAIRDSVRLAPGSHVLPHGLSIEADGVTVDGTGATLIGSDRQGVGIRMRGRANIALRNVGLQGYHHGVYARDCRELTIEGCRIAGTAEIAPNTIFLDIWRRPEEAYGGAILLWDVAESWIERNDLQHQQNGLLAYNCRRLTVRHNLAGYNSGAGFYLSATSDSTFEENGADYCCRFEPREGGLHYGHMGADAAGFIAVHGSCRNVFRRNTARLGGDGFFLAGLAPDGRHLGCDDNLFEENDGSLSPNIAFEATFSRGNIFRGNYADRSNYGFWLGFSTDTTLDRNRMVLNRQAGIAVENGHGFAVRDNTFEANGHGILLWSRREEALARTFPDRLTSYAWLIERNLFVRNGTGVRIAADQDHGIRPLPPTALVGKPETRPRRHVLRGNNIQGGRLGIELVRADETIVEGNTLCGNVEANLREDDAHDTIARNNLGAAGGYL